MIKTITDEKISNYEDPCEFLNVTNNFKYYEVHDFHKLHSTALNKNSSHFSIFHTNICSLQSNFENLETLIHDLDINFDVITLSETWNPENKNHLYQPPTLENYHPLKTLTEICILGLSH